MSAKIDQKKIDDIIYRNIDDFKKPGAFTVRPGYKMTDGWITDKQAIVVTVDKKLDGLSKKQQLPKSIGGIPVDVREATGLQRLRAKSPANYELAKLHIRGEKQEPNWDYERSVQTGQLINQNAKSSSSLGLQSGTAKKNIPYTSPINASLKKFTGNTTILACASPDDGFPVLKDFLSNTTSDLTIGMYDFTSADLMNEVVNVIKGGKKFRMVLDHPPKNPTANQTDDVTRTTILASDPNAEINWALTRNDPVVTEWIFPTAYHIKVVVRDADNGNNGQFWLSSGNFNVSNEPNLAAGDPHKGSLKNADRDWHVIISNNELAQTFKAFIDNDFSTAQSGQSEGDPVIHHLIRSAMDELQNESNKSTFQEISAEVKAPSSFKHQIFNNIAVTIQPLLTPDKGSTYTTMYVDNVLALINSATKTLYMQTQYIHPSAADADKDFMLLIEALKNAKEKKVDVKLILSQYENTSQWIELLNEYDLVVNTLRIQNRVHNKGIIADSKVVMVSSENWSADGTLRNRDAGVIIENSEVAAYFQTIFLDDWKNRANVKIVDESHPV